MPTMLRDGRKKNTKDHAEKKSGGAIRAKQQRCDDALARQSAYDALTIADKLQLASNRRGDSKKEIAKLKGERKRAADEYRASDDKHRNSKEWKALM